MMVLYSKFTKDIVSGGINNSSPVILFISVCKDVNGVL